MKIGEEQLPLPEQRGFLRLRFLYFHDEVGLPEDRGGRIDQLRPGLGVILIHVIAADTGIFFHHHPVAVLDQLIGPGGQQADTVFAVLNFTGMPMIMILFIL